MENFSQNANIHKNIAKVHRIISERCQKCGRKPEEIQLVAVSKKHPPQAIEAIREAGQLVLGESRIQEAVAKIPQLPSDLQWHFIGHLQKNKIRQALPFFDRYHGIHSLALAQSLDRHAQEAGQFPNGLLQVNISGEATKYGLSPQEAPAVLEATLELTNLQIDGLMTMAPLSKDPEEARVHFAALRELRDRLQESLQIGLPELSMGMSGDYPVAIEEGATLIRVGTAIFGAPQR